MKIIVSVSFLVVLGLFFFATQVPITLTSDEIAKAVSEASSEFPAADEELLERALELSVAKLEKGQSTRLKYLASAYFVIWLVFMLYVLRLGQQQQALDKRLAQLEQTPDDSPSTPDEE